ncbi:unnamed protein product [Rotaria socialis]|uniref:Protein YIPF n=1 Tax=Rotaria socialis TaxID=392032 RepID=A0A818UME5_9BILA|nr:unnamed protein product [Rotaria socialis]CAF3222959.1 unnamed protein product [Rotaria socialis]CAF3507387.1 unnamed protein product [Rotaria socialis]CAF3578555.1 unnamed protein product [Rotaria socialis]CAF3700387.1 unnamed protein product [Rotaria socialis]
MSDDQSFFLSTSKPIEIIEGNITSASNQNELSTLDEPIIETVKRDLKAVLRKFGHALIPRQSSTLLQQWDLWGPLILVTVLAILLQSDTTTASSGMQFAEIFTLVLIGSVMISINSQLLGGKISFFQSVCVLGYCLLPLLIAAFSNNLLLYLPYRSMLHIIRFLIVMTAFAWTMYASIRFLGQTQQPSRRMLALYPIFLFYFLVSWLIILRKPFK